MLTTKEDTMIELVEYTEEQVEMLVSEGVVCAQSSKIVDAEKIAIQLWEMGEVEAMKRVLTAVGQA